MPPVPVTVISREATRRDCNSLSSCFRPTKDVSCVGRLCAVWADDSTDCGAGDVSKPNSRARTVASVRLLTLNFAKICLLYHFTVPTESTSSSAIARLERPSQIRVRISCSRDVSSAAFIRTYQLSLPYLSLLYRFTSSFTTLGRFLRRSSVVP